MYWSHSKSDLKNYKLSCQNIVKVEVSGREGAFDFAFLTGRSSDPPIPSTDDMYGGSSASFLYPVFPKRWPQKVKLHLKAWGRMTYYFYLCFVNDFINVEQKSDAFS